jgi:hypothetical protein
MKILGLVAYRSGYMGFLEEADQFVYFRLSAKQVRRLQTYDKASFNDYNHFIGLMSRFFPATAFYKEPVPVANLSLDDLDNIFIPTGKGRKD